MPYLQQYAIGAQANLVISIQYSKLKIHICWKSETLLPSSELIHNWIPWLHHVIHQNISMRHQMVSLGILWSCAVTKAVISKNYISSTYPRGKVKFPYFHQDIILEFLVLFPTHYKHIRVEYPQLQPWYWSWPSERINRHFPDYYNGFLGASF
jgi:hypothetical protein